MENCINTNSKKDERPVIHVSSSRQYFNITKSGEFKDVIFDGINSFGSITKVGLHYKPNSTRYWPTKLCEIDSRKNQ